MALECFTGLPGSGKSLALVERMMRYKQTEPDRPVFCLGVDGLRDGIAQPITEADLYNWHTFEKGSIIVIDEVQKWAPARRAGEAPPWIKKLSEHRHFGVDFLFATQHPNMLDTYLRGLIARHTHNVQKFGTHFVDRYEWPDCCMSPVSKGERKRAIKTMWHFPRKLFGLYKSAELHTVRRRIPWKVWSLPLCAIFVAVAVYAVDKIMMKPYHDQQSKTAVASSPAAFSSSSSATQPEHKVLTPEEYAKRFIPRVLDQPWSAPAYDEDAINSHPDLLCVIHPGKYRDDDCSCYSEQNTPLKIPFSDCQNFALNGVYNPHRQPVGDYASASASVSAQSPQPSLAARGVSGGSSPDGRASRVGSPYDPAVFRPVPHTDSIGGVVDR